MQFDERVIKAVEILWITQNKSESNNAREMLKEAAREGDAEANFFLARCYAGPSYVNKAYEFPEDDTLAGQYLEKSLELGSPLGMIGARRFSVFRPYKGSYIYPPYTSNREVWDAINAIAKQETNAITIFCKYMIGNAYYYGDVVELSEFPEEQVDEQTVKAFMIEGARFYEECLRDGGGFASGNLIQIYENGEYLPKDPAMVLKFKEMAADLNVGKYMVDVFTATATSMVLVEYDGGKVSQIRAATAQDIKAYEDVGPKCSRIIHNWYWGTGLHGFVINGL